MTDNQNRIAWIETISEAEATGDIQQVYKRSAEKSGDVDNIMKIHSLHPKSLLDHRRLYKTLMVGESPLSRTQREMIGVVVSVINHCKY